MAYISASGQGSRLEHYHALLRRGTRWCTAPSSSRGVVGCGRLSRNHAETCAGCGSPTRPAVLTELIGTLPGVNIGEPPARTMDADLADAISYIFLGLPGSEGVRTLSHTEVKALADTYDLDDDVVEFLVDLAGAAVDANNRGVGAGLRYVRGKPSLGRKAK